MWVEPGKMCMSEMMSVDARGGLGLAGIDNLLPLEYDKYARRGSTIFGTRPRPVAGLCAIPPDETSVEALAAPPATISRPARAAAPASHSYPPVDRKRVVQGKRVSGRADLGGRRQHNKKNTEP